MEESKIALTKRLQREGLWEAACQFRDEVRQRLRAEGHTRKAANDGAWEAMAEHFPPVVVPAVATLDVATTARDLDPAGQVSASECFTQGAPYEDPWPVVQGEGGDLTADVRWVYENFHRLGASCDIGRAVSPPPGNGAVGLAQWAVANPSAFFKDMVPKVVRDDQDDEGVKRKSLRQAEEIKAMLAEVLRESQEMAANLTGQRAQGGL